MRLASLLEARSIPRVSFQRPTLTALTQWLLSLLPCNVFLVLTVIRHAFGGSRHAGSKACASYDDRCWPFASGKVEKRQLLPRIHMVRFC